jgi:hypothetical protein
MKTTYILTPFYVTRKEDFVGLVYCGYEDEGIMIVFIDDRLSLVHSLLYFGLEEKITSPLKRSAGKFDILFSLAILCLRVSSSQDVNVGLW